MAMATVLGTFVLSYPPQAESATMDAELVEPYVYVPSDITKANPNIRVADGHAIWRTTNVSDVADEVKYTIRGTILEIRDPIDWYTYDDVGSGHGSIPVIMSVETVYKGSIDSDTFTFFLGSFLIHPDVPFDASVADAVGSTKEYYLYPFDPQFEVGDQVLVHIFEAKLKFDSMLINSQDKDLLIPYHTTPLGKYSTYHIHGDKIYNDTIPHGAPISRAINESQPIEMPP